MLSRPLWLWGLLSLAVPLLLHLWSQRPGRVIKVGSTRHLTDLPPVHRFSLRLTEGLLLALRLGVLAAVALALADPRLPLAAPTATAPIVLVSGEVARDASRWLSDRWLDSVATAGAPLTLLAAGFPGLDPAHPPADSADPTPLWDRLAEADRRLPAGRPFVVVAAARIGTLGAARPRLSRPVAWHDAASAPPRWSLAGAWTVPPSDNIELLLREGDSTGMRTVRATIPGVTGVRPSRLGPAVEVLAEGAARRVRLLGADADSTAVTVDRVAPLRIGLSDWNTDDARRLELAAITLGEALGQPVSRASVPDSADLTLVPSAASAGRRRMLVPAAWLPLTTLPDSLLRRWPLPAPLRARSDPRRAAPAQAVPVMAGRDGPAPEPARPLGPALLWLALSLLAVERLVAAGRRRTG